MPPPNSTPNDTTEAATPTISPRFAEAPPADWDGPSVHLEQLPAEALSTLVLIAADGPYPYDQDGSTFQNCEGILPDRSSGFYREYTVETPGSRIAARSVSWSGMIRLSTTPTTTTIYSGS